MAVCKEQVIDLSHWTAYLSAQNRLLDQRSEGEVRVLLEVYRPEDEESFLERSFNTPRIKQVKVTDISTPLAWKSGSNPFGIILSCSEENFVTLCTAFYYGCLVMDEILEVQELISVKTTGRPHSLFEKSKKLSDTVNNSDMDNKAAMKPPNVLIYCGKRDSERNFQEIKHVISKSLDTNCYIIYHLSHEKVSSTPWMENTSLLIIACERLYDDSDKTFFNFYKTGGKILNFGSTFEKLFLESNNLKKEGLPVITISSQSGDDITVVRSQSCFNDLNPLDEDCSIDVLVNDSNGVPVVVSATCSKSGGKSILSQILLEKETKEMSISSEMFNKMKKSETGRHLLLASFLEELGISCGEEEKVSLSPAYLLTDSQETKNAFLKEIRQRSGSSMMFKSSSLSVKFFNKLLENKNEITPQYLPVVLDPNIDMLRFDHATFTHNLSTHTLGHVVLYSDVTSSTMTITDTLLFAVPTSVGLVVVADQQTRGKGRGGNAWLSPRGCAQFTVNVHLPLTTRLGSRASILQHIAGLAVVKAVRTLQGYEDIHIRQKWPNDIYFSDQIKIGGVLVKATVFQGNLIAQIGVGINVSNSLPTSCLNDIISEYNRCHNVRLTSLSSEQVIARILSCLEKLIDEYQEDGGISFLEEYYKYWLHSGVHVKVESAGNIEGEIVGLDEYGFLSIKDKNDRLFSVQSDGNTFDMMKNLIVLKQQ